jgi:hypothetical protein
MRPITIRPSHVLPFLAYLSYRLYHSDTPPSESNKVSTPIPSYEQIPASGIVPEETIATANETDYEPTWTAEWWSLPEYESLQHFCTILLLVVSVSIGLLVWFTKRRHDRQVQSYNEYEAQLLIAMNEYMQEIVGECAGGSANEVDSMSAMQELCADSHINDMTTEVEDEGHGQSQKIDSMEESEEEPEEESEEETEEESEEETEEESEEESEGAADVEDEIEWMKRMITIAGLENHTESQKFINFLEKSGEEEEHNEDSQNEEDPVNRTTMTSVKNESLAEVQNETVSVKTVVDTLEKASAEVEMGFDSKERRDDDLVICAMTDANRVIQKEIHSMDKTEEETGCPTDVQSEVDWTRSMINAEEKTQAEVRKAMESMKERENETERPAGLQRQMNWAKTMQLRHAAIQKDRNLGVIIEEVEEERNDENLTTSVLLEVEGEFQVEPEDKVGIVTNGYERLPATTEAHKDDPTSRQSPVKEAKIQRHRIPVAKAKDEKVKQVGKKTVQLRSAQPPSPMANKAKVVSSNVTKYNPNQKTGRIIHFEMPDYRKVPPKVNTSWKS